MPWYHYGSERLFVREQREHIKAHIKAHLFFNDGEVYKCEKCWRKCEFEVHDGIVTHRFVAENPKEEEAGNK